MKHIFLSLSMILSTYVLADEWLDIAQDLQTHIEIQVPISIDTQQHIDTHLLWAYQCYGKGLNCSTENEKQSIRETLQALEGLSKKYDELGVKNTVLDYVVSKAELIRAMSQEDVPPMGPVVTDRILQLFYNDTEQTYDILYDKKVLEQTNKHQNALKYLPAGVVIPNVPRSRTYQAIVIDISDQRIYAFEDEMLVYTSPITSGKNGFGTVVGTFSVMEKERNKLLRSPFKDEHYSLHVDYWIQFYPKYGIHDACNTRNCWRKEFGGQDYKTRGSHGCVNSPYDTVKWLYDWALEGTVVKVQK